MNGFAFSKWMNNVYLPNNPDKHWVKQSASKAVKQSITNQTIVKLDKSLKRQQRKLSRKKNGSHNWDKQLLKVQRLYRHIKNIKRNIKRKGILSIVRTNPQFITIENLNIKGMMRNKRLANSFQQIGLGCIVEWLKIKCQDCGIELRQVDRFYPSSQICSDCGRIQPMPLNQRTFHCHHCGIIKDRDINASINLKQATDYTVIV